MSISRIGLNVRCEPTLNPRRVSDQKKIKLVFYGEFNSNREIHEIHERKIPFAYFVYFAVQFGMDNRRRRAQL